jgi:tRNA (guanine10-N2)-dimethyltransferase
MIDMNNKTPELAFLLLGGNATIPYSECESILKSNGVPYDEVERLDQVLILCAPVEACQIVVRQAGMVRRGCVVLASSKKTPTSMIRAIDDLNLEHIKKPPLSFAVRVKGVKGHSKGINVSELEKELGARIKKKMSSSRVDLENPDILFYTIITNDRALFCMNLAEAEEEGFTKRRPGFRPFFHPSSMHPRLARAMVNLSGARLGSRFLDPFCGSGGILLEASVIGCNAVGLDIDLEMVRGSKTNLETFASSSFNVIAGDARHLPLEEVDAIATDPPYGRSSSTKGKETRVLVGELFDEITSLLGTRGKLCLSVPSDVRIDEGARKELRMLEEHLVRVHRSLVRRITVFSKK